MTFESCKVVTIGFVGFIVSKFKVLAFVPATTEIRSLLEIGISTAVLIYTMAKAGGALLTLWITWKNKNKES